MHNFRQLLSTNKSFPSVQNTFLHRIYVRFRFLFFFFNGKSISFLIHIISCHGQRHTYNKIINNLLIVLKLLILLVIFQYWKSVESFLFCFFWVQLLLMKFSETLIFPMLYFQKLYPVIFFLVCKPSCTSTNGNEWLATSNASTNACLSLGLT